MSMEHNRGVIQFLCTKAFSDVVVHLMKVQHRGFLKTGTPWTLFFMSVFFFMGVFLLLLFVGSRFFMLSVDTVTLGAWNVLMVCMLCSMLVVAPMWSFSGGSWTICSWVGLSWVLMFGPAFHHMSHVIEEADLERLMTPNRSHLCDHSDWCVGQGAPQKNQIERLTRAQLMALPDDLGPGSLVGVDEVQDLLIRAQLACMDLSPYQHAIARNALRADEVARVRHHIQNHLARNTAVCRSEP